MNFQEAEKIYKDLKAQHAAGKLNDAAFEAEAGKLRLQDAQGRWWQIGVQSGEWYMHDGHKWLKAKPPVAPPPPSEPPPPPPVTEKPKVTPKPEPKAEAAPASKPARGTGLPARLFSAKPAGREGNGLPRGVLIGIIAIVAIIGIAVLVGGYVLISGFLGGTTAARPTVTPTRAIAVLPTPALPTLPPPPTDTPLPPPTAVMPSPAVITPTATLPRPAGPTATRKPAGSPTPAPSPTPNVPPGVYVTKLVTNPAKPNIGDTISFKVTFLNTTGSSQFYTWLVKVYQCPEQCQDFKHSYGETTRVSSHIGTPSVELETPKHINLGVGKCDYIAIPHYVDPTNQQIIPFQSLKGNPLYVPFSACK